MVNMSNRIVTFQIVRHFPLNHGAMGGSVYTWMSQEVRIKGDRISGLCHPNSSPIYKYLDLRSYTFFLVDYDVY